MELRRFIWTGANLNSNWINNDVEEKFHFSQQQIFAFDSPLKVITSLQAQTPTCRLKCKAFNNPKENVSEETNKARLKFDAQNFYITLSGSPKVTSKVLLCDSSLNLHASLKLIYPARNLLCDLHVQVDGSKNNTRKAARKCN